MRNLGTSLTHDQAQQLTAFFASHLHAPGAPRTNLGFLQQAMGGIQPGVYSDAELALLRSIPMFLTTSGELTSIDTSVHSVVSPTAFIQPQSDTCLKFQEDPAAKRFLQALGVPELSDSEVMAKFALPGFETKDPREQERILNHLLVRPCTPSFPPLSATSFPPGARVPAKHAVRNQELTPSACVKQAPASWLGVRWNGLMCPLMDLLFAPSLLLIGCTRAGQLAPYEERRGHCVGSEANQVCDPGSHALARTPPGRRPCKGDACCLGVRAAPRPAASRRCPTFPNGR